MDTVLWLVWIAYFLIVEGWALVSPKTGDTLSEHVWEWFGITHKGQRLDRPISANVRLRRFGLLAFMSWLLVHFMSGGYV